MEIFPEEEARREQFGERYTGALANKVETPHITSDRASVYAQYTSQASDREASQADLSEADVPAAVHYPVPLYRQPAFARLETDSAGFPNCEAESDRVLSQPVHSHLPEVGQGRISEALHEAKAQ